MRSTVSADRHRVGLGHQGARAGLAALLAVLFVGCSDDVPECDQPALTNEQEAALLRSVLATTEGMVATAQGTAAAEVVATVSDFQADHDDHLIDPDPCGDYGSVLMVYQLVVADLIANADTISPELAAGLTRAAQEDGAGGISTFLDESDVFYSNEFPGLAELRDRVRVQRDRTDEVYENSSWLPT